VKPDLLVNKFRLAGAWAIDLFVASAGKDNENGPAIQEKAGPSNIAKGAACIFGY
jgi:hypothetical protein